MCKDLIEVVPTEELPVNVVDDKKSSSRGSWILIGFIGIILVFFSGAKVLLNFLMQ